VVFHLFGSAGVSSPVSTMNRAEAGVVRMTMRF
jgi:hypothetical protein